MRILLLFTYILLSSFSSITLYSQTIDTDCDCDITITSPNQQIPNRGNSGNATRDQTVCIIGNFEYTLNPNNRYGDNVTFCVGENIKFNLNSIDFRGEKTFYNNGELNIIDESLIDATVYSKNGKITFSGDNQQTLKFNGVTDIKSLIINNRRNVNIQSSINVLDHVELINGNLNTNYSTDTPENNLITFKSDSLKTAILKEVKGSSRINGAVRVERFLSNSNRAYRYLSSSVNSLGSIRDNWQEGVNNTVNNYNSNLNPNPGYGTHITGNKQGNNGFDATLTGNPSLFLWTTEGNWNAISNTDQNTLIAGKAYSLMVRGTRNTNIYSSNSAYSGSTTLRSTGNLEIGNVDVSEELNPTPEGFSLVGNPYQAQVDMKKTLKESSSHLNQNFYYAWSPALQTRGGYVTVDLEADPVEFIPSAQNFNFSNQDNFRYIQPNQSVFIQTESSASEQNRPTLVFKEEYKTNATTANEVFSIPEQVGQIDLTLVRNENNKVVDGVRFKFSDDYSNEVNQNDATKVWNSEESFGIKSNDTEYLAIEKRKYPEVDEKLEFWIGNYTTQDYKMIVKLSDIEAFEVFLKDNYLDETFELADGDNEINFNVDNSISESTSSDRFELYFEPVTLSTDNPNELVTDVRLYPNPSYNGTVYLSHDSSIGSDYTIEVYSMIGQKMGIPSERTTNSEVKLNTNSLSSGIYLVKFSNQSKSTTQKLVVK